MDRDLERRLGEVRYLLFDLDGTLLTGDKRITQYSADVLMRAREKGYRIAFSTGRSLGALAGFTYPVGLETDAPSIGCAGGEIGYVVHDRVTRLRADSFPVDELRSLLLFALERGLNFSLDGTGPRYYSEGLDYIETYRRDRERAVSFGMRYPDLIEIKRDPDAVEQALDGTVVKPMVWYRTAEEKELMGIWAAEHPGYTYNSSGFSLVEVQSETVNKARALEYACAVAGIPPEQCCVFGDSENDVSILERAGVSVAMCSGFEAAKQISDIITEKGNDEDGAALAVEELFL